MGHGGLGETNGNSMVNEGLLKKDSPRGIWETSDKGEGVWNG